MAAGVMVTVAMLAMVAAADSGYVACEDDAGDADGADDADGGGAESGSADCADGGCGGGSAESGHMEVVELAAAACAHAERRGAGGTFGVGGSDGVSLHEQGCADLSHRAAQPEEEQHTCEHREAGCIYNPSRNYIPHQGAPPSRGRPPALWGNEKA